MRTKTAVVVPLWIGLLPSVGWNLVGSWKNPWIDDAISKIWILRKDILVLVVSVISSGFGSHKGGTRFLVCITLPACWPAYHFKSFAEVLAKVLTVQAVGYKHFSPQHCHLQQLVLLIAHGLSTAEYLLTAISESENCYGPGITPHLFFLKINSKLGKFPGLISTSSHKEHSWGRRPPMEAAERCPAAVRNSCLCHQALSRTKVCRHCPDLWKFGTSLSLSLQRLQLSRFLPLFLPSPQQFNINIHSTKLCSSLCLKVTATK